MCKMEKSDEKLLQDQAIWPKTEFTAIHSAYIKAVKKAPHIVKISIAKMKKSTCA